MLQKGVRTKPSYGRGSIYFDPCCAALPISWEFRRKAHKEFQEAIVEGDIVRVRRGLMLLLIMISLTLASGTYMLVPDTFEETLHDGHDSSTSPRMATIRFPGRSSNWQLDIDLVMEEMPIDFVVSWFHLTWADYESDDEYKWGVLYEAFNVTEINETLDLNMSVYISAHILIRGMESGMYDMRGPIIATCDYYRPVIPLMVRDELWLLAFVVTAVLIGDIISTYISRRETETS